MKKLPLLVALLASTAANATDIELNLPGGRFEDCELIDLGSEGSISGNMLIRKSKADSKWASSAALILVEDTKPNRTFRFSLATVSNSKKLLARYEYFNGENSLIRETLARTDIDKELNYSMSWDKRGVIQISADESPRRMLEVAIKPDRAFILISGANAKVSTSGNERIDCSRVLTPESPGGG